MSARLTTAISIGDAAMAFFRKTQSFPNQDYEEPQDWSEHEHVSVETMLLAAFMAILYRLMKP